MKKSKKITDDEILPVIDGAELSKLRDNCSALIETLDKLRYGALAALGDDRRTKARYRGDSYTMVVQVCLRVKDEKWQGSTDRERWTSPQPTRDAAINAALKSDLTRILKQIKDNEEAS